MRDLGRFEKGKYIPSILEVSLEQHDNAINSDRFQFTLMDRVKLEDLLEELGRRIVGMKAEGQPVAMTRYWGPTVMDIKVQVNLMDRQDWKIYSDR